MLEGLERLLSEPQPQRTKQRLSLEIPIVPSTGKPFGLTSDEIYDLIDLP